MTEPPPNCSRCGIDLTPTGEFRTWQCPICHCTCERRTQNQQDAQFISKTDQAITAATNPDTKQKLTEFQQRYLNNLTRIHQLQQLGATLSDIETWTYPP